MTQSRNYTHTHTHIIYLYKRIKWELCLRKQYDDQSNFSSSGIHDYVIVHTDLLKGRAEDLKPDPYLRKSPSLESLSRPPSLGFGNTRLLSASTGGLKPQSKLRYQFLNSEISENHWTNNLVFFPFFFFFVPYCQFTSTNISWIKMIKTQ